MSSVAILAQAILSQVVALEALLLACSSDGDGDRGRGVDAHCGGCAREGLLPRVDVSPRGGRGSTGIRVPCKLPRVRALRAALPSRGCVAQGVVTRGGQHALAPRRRRPVRG